MSSLYNDIINLPHHVSEKHPRMSMHDRAAQFSPFAALVGYEAAINETARSTEQQRELDEQEMAVLNRQLSFLAENLEKKPLSTIRYFAADERKSGGAYKMVTGIVKRISSAEAMLVMESGEKISFSDILSITTCDCPSPL